MKFFLSKSKGQNGVGRFEIGHRRNDHHVTEFERRNGFHVRRSCPEDVEEHFMGILHPRLLVY